MSRGRGFFWILRNCDLLMLIGVGVVSRWSWHLSWALLPAIASTWSYGRELFKFEMRLLWSNWLSSGMNSFTLTRMEYFAQESVPPFIQFSTNEYLPIVRNLPVKVHQRLWNQYKFFIHCYPARCQNNGQNRVRWTLLNRSIIWFRPWYLLL